MKFSIITPSLNQLPYLKRCIASVADQPGIEIEHIVVDGGSSDGTRKFLSEHIAQQSSTGTYQLFFVSEADEGMYDALNKGFERISGEICAWLNCDEQFLPGALNNVARFFDGHPKADMVCGDALLVSPDGQLLTCRKNPPLRRAYVLADHLYIQSAALFFRRRIFGSGLRFDPSWRAVGDCDFVLRALDAGFHCGQIRDYLAACTMTGENLSCGLFGVEELRRFRQKAPLRYRFGRPVLNASRYCEKFLRGGYRQQAPLEYDLYFADSNVRKRMVSESPGCRFKWEAHV